MRDDIQGGVSRSVVLWVPRGEMQYDDDGLAICHLCGKAFESIGNHTWLAHDIRSAEYRQIAGLTERQSLGSLELSERRAKIQLDRYESDPKLLEGARSHLVANQSKARAASRAKAGKPIRLQRLNKIRDAMDDYWKDGRPRIRTSHSLGDTCSVCGTLFTSVTYLDGKTGKYPVRSERRTCSTECAYEMYGRAGSMGGGPSREEASRISKEMWESEIGQAMKARRAAERAERDRATPHGCRAKYSTYGCRCDPCKEAHAKYYRLRRRGKTPEYHEVLV